jgi:hypothetical protein
MVLLIFGMSLVLIAPISLIRLILESGVVVSENNTRRLILLDGPLRTHDETTTIDGVQAIEQFFMENSSNIKAEVNANEVVFSSFRLIIIL